MNSIIRQRFDTIEALLIENPVIISYEVLRLRLPRLMGSYGSKRY
jgi:hypothetical protein